VVAQKLGFRTEDELKSKLSKSDIYEWMALAILQGWFRPPIDEFVAEDPVEVLRQWSIENSNSR
jgi:hypothetical protein